MLDEIEISGKDVKVVTLGNTELEVASNDGEVVVGDLKDVDEVRINLGPELMGVKLANGSKTVITSRLYEYIENNGDWEIEQHINDSRITFNE